ncbi:MAG: hypothetical protein KDD37_01565 [Bdellovibrionales bacterium]|nr:hypothetical protein [Bdellovibrionales bacterium]
MTLLLLYVSTLLHAKQVCAPNTGGASFNLGCKLVSEEEAKKMQKEILAKKTKSHFIQSEKIKIGSYSGRAGYFALVDGKNVDLIVMNAKALSEIQNELKDVNLGELKSCELEGLSQKIGYTLFAINSCD